MKKRGNKKAQKTEQTKNVVVNAKAKLLGSVLAVVVPIAISGFATWVAFDSKNASDASAAKTLALQEKLGRIQTPLDYSINVRQIPQEQGTMEQGGQMMISIDGDFAYSIALSKNEGQLYSLAKIDVLDNEAVDRIDESTVDLLQYDISAYGNDWDKEVFEFSSRQNAADASLPLLSAAREWNIAFSILVLKDTSGNEHWGLLAIPMTAKTGNPSVQKHADGTSSVRTKATLETVERDDEELNAVFLSPLEMQSNPQLLAERILDSRFKTDDQLSWAREQRAYGDAPSENGRLFRELGDEAFKARLVDEVSQMQTVFNHVKERYGAW